MPSMHAQGAGWPGRCWSSGNCGAAEGGAGGGGRPEWRQVQAQLLLGQVGGGCRGGDKRVAGSLRPGAELCDPSARLPKRGGRVARDPGQGRHGAVA